MEYLSCEWIESRVVLELKELKFCCIGHSGHKGYVPMVDYLGGPLPVEAIKQARRRLTALNNNPQVDSPCKGCHFLEQKDWRKEQKTDALFLSVYLSSFSICNLNCRYCFVYLREFTEVSNVAGYPLLPVFQEMIAQGYLDPHAYIEWGGGEPTIVKGFAELMRLLMQQGYTQQIHTSSVKYLPELEQGLRTGKVRAVTSVDAGTREAYKAVKGRDRFETVWESVKKYCASGGDMTIKYILRKNNSDAENVRGFWTRVKDCKPRRVVITPDFQELTQHEITEETLFAFALMERAAREAEMPLEIRDEHVNPEQMKRITKYIPVEQHEPEYRAEQARLAEAQQGAAATRRERIERQAGTTEDAAARVGALLEQQSGLRHPFELLQASAELNSELTGLLEHQTQFPDPLLRARLTELVASGRVPALRMNEASVVGLSADAWTLDGRPGYVVVDARKADRPVVLDMWFTCCANAQDYPLHLSVSDGEHDDIQFTYYESLQLRVELPAVPPGESRIYAVKTDKTWMPVEGEDRRHFGVRVSTSI
jgi:molybdenum cofactor biosynthesis enzyme MoaA